MKIAVSGVGKRTQLIRMAKASLSRAIIYCLDNNPHAPALAIGDRCEILPRATDTNFAEFVANFVIRESIDKWITIIDPEMIAMSELWRAGCDVFIMTRKPDICFDKWLMFELCNRCSISTPRTSLIPLRSFPQVAKDRFGSGASGFRILTSPGDVFAAVNKAHATEHLIFQEYISGTHCDIDFYVDLVDLQVKSIVVRQVLNNRNGETYQAKFVKCPAAIKCLIERIAEFFELIGPNNADIIAVEGQCFLIDINPRFGGNYPATHLVGHDYWKMLERNLAGGVNVQNRFYREDIVMNKFLQIEIGKT